MICFVNKSKYPINIYIGEITYCIKANDSMICDIKGQSKIKIVENRKSYIKTLSKFKSFLAHYNFNLLTNYIMNGNYDNATIILNSNILFGNNNEQYEIIIPESMQIKFELTDYFVFDSNNIKMEIMAFQKNLKKKNRFWNIVDIILTALYLIVPFLALEFLLIIQSLSFKESIAITLPIYVFGVGIAMVLKKVVNRFNNKLDTLSKDNEYVFNGIDDYFNSEYIKLVMKNNLR